MQSAMNLHATRSRRRESGGRVTGLAFDVLSCPEGYSMRAAVLEAAQRLVVRDLPAPLPAPDEVTIAIELAGVCGSDVSLYLGHRPGPYPFIVGHEAIGRVVEPGQSGRERGARVVIEPNFPCGACSI